MSNVALLVTKTTEDLEEIANKAKVLGVGLQHASPAQLVASNQSIQYLLAISEQLEAFAAECRALQLTGGKTKEE